MTILGIMSPKLIARMIVKALMPSATVAPKSGKVAFALLASCRRPLDILKRKTPGSSDTDQVEQTPSRTRNDVSREVLERDPAHP